MNKKILLGIVVLAIAGVSVVNVNFNSRSNKLSGVSLANVEALAQEGGNNARDCPGGYCKWTSNFGDSCVSCCPTGKNPRCTSSACECN